MRTSFLYNVQKGSKINMIEKQNICIDKILQFKLQYILYIIKSFKIIFIHITNIIYQFNKSFLIAIDIFELKKSLWPCF